MPRTSKKSLEKQKYWENRIARAKSVKKNWKELFKVDLIREYIDGKQKHLDYDNADWITINNIYSHMKAQLPALYSADPYFYVTLTRCYKPNPELIAGYELRGKIRAAKLNHLKRELKMKPKNRIAIMDALCSFGVTKTSFAANLNQNPDAGKPMIGENNEPLRDENGQELINPEYIPTDGYYRLDRIHPDDILFDEDAGPLEDSWSEIYHRIRMPIDEAKINPRYKNAVLKRIEGKGESKDDDEKAREERKKGGDIVGKSENGSIRKKEIENEPEMVVFWDIYRLKKKTWLTIVENGDVPVADESPLPKGIELHPFEFLFFTARDDSPYPHPPLSPLLSPADEYNQARSDIQKHRKRFNRKYAASRSALGNEYDTVVSKFESGDDGTVVPCQGDARGAIAAIQDAQLDPMRYQELAYLKAEMVELAGHNSAESMGLASADSATQSAILDKRLEIKEGDAMSMVVDFVLSQAEKLDQLVQIHLDQEEAVKVVGPEGEFWQIVRPKDYEEIEGEYSYTVNVGALTPRMPHIERASWQAFLALLANFPHLAMSKRLLVKMAEMHHIEDEAMINELYEIAKRILGGQYPMPGQTGSQAGISEERPVSAIGGQAGGVQSLSKGNAAIGG